MVDHFEKESIQRQETERLYADILDRLGVEEEGLEVVVQIKSQARGEHTKLSFGEEGLRARMPRSRLWTIRLGLGHDCHL